VEEKLANAPRNRLIKKKTGDKERKRKKKEGNTQNRNPMVEIRTIRERKNRRGT